MYEEACVYGKENIKGTKKSFTNQIKVLLDKKLYEHWVDRMEGLMATRYLENSMYYYADDAEANHILEEFLCDKKITVKEGSEVSVEFKTWLHV